MRIKAVLIALLLAACPAFAQQLNPTTQINWPLITGQGTPTSLNLACTSQVGLTVNITTSGGVVTGASIAAGGSGILVVPQTMNLLGGGGTGALLTITAASGGAATAITVTAGGSGYSNTSAVRASLANFGQPFQNLAVTPNTYYTCGNDGWAVRGGASSLSLTTTGTSGAASLSGSVLNVPQYQAGLTLTTTGSSGPATLSGGALNIPQYSGGSCSIGTCIVNAGTASQTITQGSGFNLGYVGTSWGINPVFNNSADFSETFGHFITDPTDMGGANGGKGGSLDSQTVTFDNAGHNWGYSVNNSTQWFTGIGQILTTNFNAAGIGAALAPTINHPSVGDSIGVSVVDQVNGGYQALSDEGAVGNRIVVQEGSSSAGLVVSGGTTGSLSMVVNVTQTLGVGRIIYDTAATTGVITTTQTLGSSTSGIQTVNLGTTVAQSTCGILAGGPTVTTTSYSITSNVITIAGTNSLYNLEQIVLSGYGTSTFLNGQTVTVIASTGTAFTAIFTHANVSLTTEAGAFNTVNVDTPRQANNGSVSMTFGITLGSAYVGSTTALISMGGAGFIDTSQLSAVGSYTGGVQFVTAPLIHPILSGATVCMGGLAGYGELNTTSPFGSYLNFIIGSPTTNTALTVAIPAGRPTTGYAKAGNVTLYPIAVIQSISPASTPTVTITPNSVAWANGDTISIPNGITAQYSSGGYEITNRNPYAQYSGVGSLYSGPATFQGGALFTALGNETASTLTSQGGMGFAPTLMDIVGHVGLGLHFRNRPSDAFAEGNVYPVSLLAVDGCAGGFTCGSSYYIHTDGTNANPGTGIEFFPATGIYNFHGSTAAVIQQNGTAVCLQSGTNCPTGVTSLTGDSVLFSNSASTGAVTLTPRTPAQNSVLAGPATGGTGAFSFRALQGVDLPLATTSLFGAVKPDGTSITISGGVISSVGVGTTTVIQVNGTPTSTATPVNLQTSTANSVGLTVTPSNPSVGNVKFEVTGSSYTGNAATATALAATPTQCSGGTPIATGVAANGNANCTADGGGATIAATTNVIKGDNAGNGIAATPDTDYVKPGGTITAALGNSTKSFDSNFYGESVMANTEASNGTAGPLNTGLSTPIGIRMGGLFTLRAVSGSQVADVEKIFVVTTPPYQMSKFPLQAVMQGSNEAIRADAGNASEQALFVTEYEALMAYLTTVSDNYAGAWSSATTYVAGTVVQSGGINYISTLGTSGAPAPNLNKTPATNFGYWTVYQPPSGYKIGAQFQVGATLTTGNWIPDQTLQGIGTANGVANTVQPLAMVGSSNGASMTFSVPNPTGSSNPFLVQRIQDGNTGTASVTVDGVSAGTLQGNALSSAVIQTSSSFLNTDAETFTTYTASATAAACTLTNSALTSNVATLTCASAFGGLVGQAVTFKDMVFTGTAGNLPFLNGTTQLITGVSGSTFTVAFTHANVGSAAEVGTATPGHAVTVTITSTPTNASVSTIAIATNVVTCTCTNTFSVGQAVVFSGLTTNTFLNGVTLTILTASGSVFTAAGTALGATTGQWAHANVSTVADTGQATLNWISLQFADAYPPAPTSSMYGGPNLTVLGVIKHQFDASSAITATYNALALSTAATMNGMSGLISTYDVRNGIPGAGVPPLDPYTMMDSNFHPSDTGYSVLRHGIEATIQPPEHINGIVLLYNGTGNATYAGISASGGNISFGNGLAGDASDNLLATGITLTGKFSVGTTTTYTPTANATTSITDTAVNNQYRLTNAAARSLVLASTGPTAGQTITIKDSAGTATTAPITVTVASGGTIDGQTSLVINQNYGSLLLQWISAGVYETKVPSAYGTGSTTVSATPGTGVTSATCASATCTTSRGSYTIVGGTATTGTIASLAWTATPTAWVCSVGMNGGTGFLGIGHSVATTTGMNITAGVTVLGLTFTVDYNCVP